MFDNYYYDHRVMAGSTQKWYERLDENNMKALFYDGYEEIWVDFTFETCPTCEGRGSHVNPSIDSHGISTNEFAEDPDFLDEYMGGLYDVPCYECRGKRVVPVSDDTRVTERIREDAEFAAIQAAERRMGA